MGLIILTYFIRVIYLTKMCEATLTIYIALFPVIMFFLDDCFPIYQCSPEMALLVHSVFMANLNDVCACCNEILLRSIFPW